MLIFDENIPILSNELLAVKISSNLIWHNDETNWYMVLMYALELKYRLHTHDVTCKSVTVPFMLVSKYSLKLMKQKEKIPQGQGYH